MSQQEQRPAAVVNGIPAYDNGRPMSEPSSSIPVVPIPGLSEAAEKNRREVSPTGTPKVKPSAVKWLLAGVLGAVAGLELTAQQHPDPTVQLACRIAAVALGTFAGVASPGFRK